LLLAAMVVLLPVTVNADVGRAEAARKNDACEHAKANALATCASGRAKQIGQCDCVERQTTLYLKNWRCAVEAKCEAEDPKQPASDGNVSPESR
jgi:hypothetical protein